MLNEPSVFESLKFYCIFFGIRGYFEISAFEISRIDCISIISAYNAFVDRLAIDGVSKNIYFTAVGPANSKTSFIGVLTPQGHFTKIVSQLDVPRDIVLHPARR